MSGLRRTVHAAANFDWKPLKHLAPDVAVQQQAPVNGSEPAEPMGLAFVDVDDGETHIYLFTEEGKANLIRQLTGGVILPAAR